MPTEIQVTNNIDLVKELFPEGVVATPTATVELLKKSSPSQSTKKSTGSLSRRKFLSFATACAVSAIFGSGCAPPQQSRLESNNFKLELDNTISTLREYIDGKIDLTGQELDQKLSTFFIYVQYYYGGYDSATVPDTVYYYSPNTLKCLGSGEGGGFHNTWLLFIDDVGVCVEVDNGDSNKRLEAVYKGIHEKTHTEKLAHGCFSEYFACGRDNAWMEVLAYTANVLAAELILNVSYSLPEQPQSANLSDLKFPLLLSNWLKKSHQTEKALAAIFHGDNPTLKNILGANDLTHWKILEKIHDLFNIAVQLYPLITANTSGNLAQGTERYNLYLTLSQQYRNLYLEIVTFITKL